MSSEGPNLHEPSATVAMLGSVFFALPGSVRKLIIGAAAVAALLLIVACVSGGMSIGRAIGDARADRDIEERKAKIAELETRRDELVKKAEAAEAQAAILREQIEALEKLAADQARVTRQAEARAEAIQDATDQSIQNVRDRPMSASDAAADVRSRLSELDAGADPGRR